MLPVNSRKIEMSDVKTLREKRGAGILPAFILAYSILIRFRIFLLTQEEDEGGYRYKGDSSMYHPKV